MNQSQPNTPARGPAPGASRPPRFFYGWVMVGLAFSTQFMITGFIFYSFGTFLKSLASDFGGGRLGITFALTIMSFSGMALAPLIGRLVGRGWLRWLMPAGALSTGLAFLALSRATEIWHFYLVFGTLFAFGGSAMAGLCAMALVVNWFERLRATALGIAALGASVGGMVMPPIVAPLVASQGWRDTYAFLGITVLCIAPVVWFLLVPNPEERSLLPDGAPADIDDGAPDPETPKETPVPRPRGFRERNLWLLALVTGLGFMSSSSVIAHLPAFASDEGYSAAQGAWLLSVLGGGAALGKIVFGRMADRLGEKRAFTTSLLAQSLSLMVLMQIEGLVALVAIAFLVGLGLGGTVPLSASLMARVFGRDAFGPMRGLMAPIMVPIQASGAPFAAWVSDSTGSYHLAFWFFAAALVVATLTLQLVKLTPQQSA